MKESNSFNKITSLSPNYIVEESSTSKGNQIKWKANNRWYKANSFGYENVAEVIASVLANNIKDFPSVLYDFAKVECNDKIYDCDVSKNFLKENENVITFARLLKYYFPKEYKGYGSLPPLRRLNLVLKLKEIVGFDFSKYLISNILFDAIILNEDRHLNNLAFIKDEQGYRECPNFDNGLSLLSDLSCYPLDRKLIVNIINVDAKPFNEDFKTQINLLKNIVGDYTLKINIKGFMTDLSEIDFSEYEEYKLRCLTVIENRLEYYGSEIWEEI